MNHSLYSQAPAPILLRRRVRRAALRRRLSAPLGALGLLLLIVAVIGLNVALGAVSVALLLLAYRWSAQPLRSLAHVGLLEWF